MVANSCRISELSSHLWHVFGTGRIDRMSPMASVPHPALHHWGGCTDESLLGVGIKRDGKGDRIPEAVVGVSVLGTPPPSALTFR